MILLCTVGVVVFTLYLEALTPRTVGNRGPQLQDAAQPCKPHSHVGNSTKQQGTMPGSPPETIHIEPTIKQSSSHKMQETLRTDGGS